MVKHITREGYNILKDELNHLIKVRRKEIAKDLERARDHGDLKENAEYDAAKEAQAMNERRIAELSEELTTSSILDDRNIPKDKVYLGATVKMIDVEHDEEVEYTLVSEAEADFFANKISVTSPIGKGLLGHKVGDEVEIDVPRGVLTYKILEINR